MKRMNSYLTRSFAAPLSIGAMRSAHRGLGRIAAEWRRVVERVAGLIEAGTPPGQAMNEVLGKGNAKK
ncbi:hypothetical protein ACFLSF_02945 [Candidatus Bipolaricaulota bacterium]